MCKETDYTEPAKPAPTVEKPKEDLPKKEDPVPKPVKESTPPPVPAPPVGKNPEPSPKKGNGNVEYESYYSYESYYESYSESDGHIKPSVPSSNPVPVEGGIGNVNIPPPVSID